MRHSNKIITGISFFLLGILSFADNIGYIHIGTEEIIGIVLVTFGLPTVYFSFNEKRRDKLFLAAVMFFVGIILIVKSTYELFDTHGMVFSSILFIGGASFFLLFIDNSKEKIFLYAALILMAAGYASTTIFKNVGIIYTANELAAAVGNFWPVILILFGLIVFLNRRN